MVEKFNSFMSESFDVSKILIDRLDMLKDIWDDLDTYLGVNIRYHLKIGDSQFEIGELISKSKSEWRTILNSINNLKKIENLPILIDLKLEETITSEFLDRLIQLSLITGDQFNLRLYEWQTYTKNGNTINWGFNIDSLISTFDMESGKMREFWLKGHNLPIDQVFGIYLVYKPINQ